MRSQLGYQPTPASSSLLSVLVTTLSNQNLCCDLSAGDMGIYTLWFPSDVKTILSLAPHSKDLILALNMITWSKQ